ncbi:ribosome recycling factor [Candidatus Viridilinea mediisalina]|uniref:Ribosome-recycling factor n=1 Tax=Candidatus Viridilinea mediisalina TaxID=2024553 RepID=A0A2A6RNL6_9CHLR|nr:ribosome recycling factor [Candidatus Viridilinea mediisalina]PDW04694.1 ribosome recycling factor [Candidatus Viridilinea mediisalina]
MVNDVIREYEAHLKKAVEALKHQLATIRTGRASAGLVEHLQVEAYGAPMPLNQLASITVPEARLIVIQPYDAGMIKTIEKAIQHSDLGINPGNDGRVIRLAVPQLTEERRREMVKVVRHRVEDVKVSVRNQRRDAIDQLKELEHEKLIGEDDMRRGQDRVQQATDRCIAELDQLGKEKEAEVMAV